MTREELVKEADKYALEWGDKTDGTYACCRDGYLAGAEPREKRIAELERKLEQTEKDLTDYQFNYPKIKDLEKENAELEGKLKAKEIEAHYCIPNCSQLTKAKELLKDILDLLPDEVMNHNYYYETFVKPAEAFLKGE
jgi:hypothetical protein